MARSHDDDVADRSPQEAGPAPAPGAIKIIAPLAGLGAAWVVPKILGSAYRRGTGNEPPRATDRNQPLQRVLMWAAVSAAALAVVQVIIDRAVSKYDL